MCVKLLFSTAALLWCAVAADNSPRAVNYTLADDCPRGGCQVPAFDKGYLFQHKPTANYPADGLSVFDPSGRLMYQVDITAPDGSAGHLLVTSADAANADGKVLLPISYGGWGGNGHVKGGGVVVLSPEGKQVRFVATGRFLPQAACFGPDDSIWVMGTQYAPLREGDSMDHVERGYYNLVRKFSSDGKPLGSFLPRSLFPKGLSPAASLGWMRASKNRIGMMTRPGQSSNNPEWVELDLDGNLVGRWKVGAATEADPDTHRIVYQLLGFAFTSDGQLYAQRKACATAAKCTNQAVMLDRETSSWKPVEGTQTDQVRFLMGADGNDLVFYDRSPDNAGGGVHLSWLRPAQPR